MRMERLTARNKNGEAYYPECYRKDGCDGFGGDCSKRWLPMKIPV